MLQWNIRAAVRWITERAGSGLLSPSESVVTVLQLKHPDPLIPPETAVPSFDDLPGLENSEITAANVQFIASRTCVYKKGLVLVAASLHIGGIFPAWFVQWKIMGGSGCSLPFVV